MADRYLTEVTFNQNQLYPEYEDLSSHYLLLNPCDGYHLAFGNWDIETHEFEGFTNWTRTEEYNKDFYAAWAKLPDSMRVEKLIK